MPEVTPPAVIRLPSLTTRDFTWVAPTRGRRSVKAQWVVARRPRKRPAAPSTKAPVHTDVTYVAALAWRRTNSIVSLSCRASATPVLPPGTQIRSRLGQDSKVHVGTRLRPQSLGTGWVDLATMCVATSG